MTKHRVWSVVCLSVALQIAKRENFYAFNLSLPTCSNLFSLNHHSQIDSCFQSLSYFLMFHPIITSFIFHMFYLKV